MNKNDYNKFHKKVKAVGVAMLCAIGVSLIFLAVGLGIYQSEPLLLIAGLPVCLSVDVTMLLLSYFLTKKDRNLRNELRETVSAEGKSPLFAEIERDYRATRLESVWDSVMPNGWRLREVYRAEDKIEIALYEKNPAPGQNPCEITVQFGETDVTVYFDYPNGQETVTKDLTSAEFADFASLVIWLGSICQQYADKAVALKQS